MGNSKIKRFFAFPVRSLVTMLTELFLQFLVWNETSCANAACDGQGTWPSFGWQMNEYGAMVNGNWHITYVEKNPVPVQLRSPQISYGLSQNWIQAAAVWILQLCSYRCTGFGWFREMWHVYGPVNIFWNLRSSSCCVFIARRKWLQVHFKENLFCWRCGSHAWPPIHQSEGELVV
jgi:hypothetical protein